MVVRFTAHWCGGLFRNGSILLKNSGGRPAGDRSQLVRQALQDVMSDLYERFEADPLWPVVSNGNLRLGGERRSFRTDGA